MQRFYDEQGTIYNRSGEISVINSPTRSNIMRPASTDHCNKCAVCDKQESLDGPFHIKRFGGFLCSNECYKEYRAKNKKKFVVLGDVDFLLRQFRRRKFLLGIRDKFSADLKSIRAELIKNEIPISRCHDKDRQCWYNLKSFKDINFPSLYQFSISTNEDAEIYPLYSKRYAIISAVQEQYEFELLSIERYLTSGKCIHYKTA